MSLHSTCLDECQLLVDEDELREGDGWMVLATATTIATTSGLGRRLRPVVSGRRPAAGLVSE